MFNVWKYFCYTEASNEMKDYVDLNIIKLQNT